MSDNKKYYYLKLKDNFFDSDAMIVLESMPDGYIYSNILLKLYLRSLKHDGKLMFNNRIPYNSTILAQVTRHSVGDVEKSIKILSELDLIEVLENGAIFMLDIQNFIGESSTEADRKREYRKRIEEEKDLLQLPDGQMSGQMSGQSSDKSPPEIEIELEKELEKDKEPKTDSKLSEKQLGIDFEKLWKYYPRKERKQDAFKAYRKAIKNGVTNKQIQDGIIGYKKKVETEGTEHQFIAQGGTWFNQQRWNDEYVISKPKPNYRKGSNHKEITPQWLKDQQEGKQPEPEPIEDTGQSEEEIRAWMTSLTEGADDN